MIDIKQVLGFKYGQQHKLAYVWQRGLLEVNLIERLLSNMKSSGCYDWPLIDP